MKKEYLKYLVLLFNIAFISINANAQNKWQPDSTAYHYLSRGNNIDQFKSSGLTTISKDLTIHNSNATSIRWDVPANSGKVSLLLLTGDIDLRKMVLYSVCRRNNVPNTITIYVNCVSGTRFFIGPTTKVSPSNFALPETDWHQMGSFIATGALNSANSNDLQHVKSISFETTNASVNCSLWIDEIKTIEPTGPVSIVHFNRFRSNADSLLVPFLLQKNLKANLDIPFGFAKSQLTETKSGLTYTYVGLNRIDTLVHNHGWSCTSHGSFYEDVRYLSATDLYKLCALDSFINHGLDARWCFSIPMDACTNSIFKQIKDWNIYSSIRKQDSGFNELPINNPYNLKFFRPTSASAGPNVGGTPFTISQMKSYVDSIQNNHGLLIMDFGSIITAPSNLFHESELTMQNDAYALVNYADSLQIPFITFEDLFKKDTAYVQHLTASDDYFILNTLSTSTLDVQLNDVAPNGSSLTLSIISPPVYGAATVIAGSIQYTPSSSCYITDTLSYTLSDGQSIDTARVFIQRMGSTIVAVKTGYCLPNTFALNVQVTGGLSPFSYNWQDGDTSQSRNVSGPDTLILIVTDNSGCSISDSLILTNNPKPDPTVTDSIQCGPGVPLCIVNSIGTNLWYDAPVAGNLLQTNGNTYTTSVNATTTFYVAVDYGTCISNRIPVKTILKKPFVQITSVDTAICPGPTGKIRLDANVDIGLSYKWLKNGIAIPTNATSNFYYSRKVASYQLQVTRNLDGCIDTSNTIIITAIDTPTISTTQGLTFCNGDSILLSLPVISGANYVWYQNNNPLINSNSDLRVFAAGTYFGIVNYHQGCALSTDTVTAIVNCTVGINEVASQPLILIAPNPSNADLTITIENNYTKELKITITNLQGSVIHLSHDNHIENGKVQYLLKTDDLPSGIYLCTIQLGTETFIRKFVVIK